MAQQGTKVAHNFADLREGEEIILTLKDQNILGDDGEINELDILENQDMAAEEKRKFNLERATKTNEQIQLEQKYEDKKTVLAKYDEATLEKEGFMLNEDGELMPDKQEQLNSIKNKLLKKGGLAQQKNTYDAANLGHNIVAREYEEETEEQKKKKKKGFQKRLNKDKKKKQNLAAYLEENLDQEDHMENHGTRGEQAARKKKENLKQELEEKKTKTDKYEQAVENANIESKKAHSRWVEEQDEMEQQLIQSLEAQRKYKKLKENTEKKKADEEVQELLQENEELEREIQEKKEREQEELKNISAPKPKIKGQKNIEYVNELSSNQAFLKRVETDEQHKIITKMENQQTSSIKDTVSGTTSIVQVSLPSERQMGWKRRQEEIEAQVPDMSVQLTEEELQKYREENELLMGPKMGKGLADTLKMLREQGSLMDKTYDYRGRNLDEKEYEERHYDPNSKEDRVKLEYRDESGRLMTKKQAYRDLCHKFHGKGPSKKTLEKRQKQELQREQMRQNYLSKDNLLMNTLKSSQKNTKQAHIQLNLGSGAPKNN